MTDIFTIILGGGLVFYFLAATWSILLVGQMADIIAAGRVGTATGIVGIVLLLLVLVVSGQFLLLVLTNKLGGS